MNVSRCNNGFVEFFSKSNNTAVEIAKLFIIFCKTLTHKESVISDRLNFKVVVPRSYLQQFLLAFSVHHCTEKLTGLTCRADYNTLAVQVEKTARNTRCLIKMVKV